MKISIYLHDTKNNKTVVRADSSHNPKSGKWPFHIHMPGGSGRKHILGTDPWKYNDEFLKFVEEYDVLPVGGRALLKTKLNQIWPGDVLKTFFS